MKSPNIPYIRALDHVRGLAALWIAIFHCIYLLGHEIMYKVPYQGKPFLPRTLNPVYIIFANGHSAVALFLVVSGFIFAYGSFGREITYSSFIKNRLLRIYPLFLTLLAFSIYTTSAPVDLSGIIGTILPFGIMSGSTPVGIPWTPFSAMFWVLIIECQFYLVFPILFVAANKHGLYRVPLLLIATFVCLRLMASCFGANPCDMAYYTIVGRFDQFLIGMMAGFMYAQRLVPESTLRRAFFPTVLLIWAAIYWYDLTGGRLSTRRWKCFMTPVEAAMWATFLLTYLEVAKRLPARLSQTLQWLGSISYSVFMLHVGIIWLVGMRHWYFRTGLGFYEDVVINFVVLVLPLVLLLSSLTYMAIEKPFLGLRGRYVSEPAGGSAAEEQYTVSVKTVSA
ncbi:MAG: acyltransferase family protein [Syntrophobacteraceae bacterium]